MRVRGDENPHWKRTKVPGDRPRPTPCRVHGCRFSPSPCLTLADARSTTSPVQGRRDLPAATVPPPARARSPNAPPAATCRPATATTPGRSSRASTSRNRHAPPRPPRHRRIKERCADPEMAVTPRQHRGHCYGSSRRRPIASRPSRARGASNVPAIVYGSWHPRAFPRRL